jgi:hypothetical protein
MFVACVMLTDAAPPFSLTVNFEFLEGPTWSAHPNPYSKP